MKIILTQYHYLTFEELLEDMKALTEKLVINFKTDYYNYDVPKLKEMNELDCFELVWLVDEDGTCMTSNPIRMAICLSQEPYNVFEVSKQNNEYSLVHYGRLGRIG